jgi:predicted aminopeptidase
MVKRITSVAALAILPAVLAGCGFPAIPYLFTSGVGELNILTGSIPMEQALNDPALSSETHEKLLWVQQVRDFARNNLGLNAGSSYLKYYDTAGGPAVYNLSASRKDVLEPYSWCFPVVGRIDYLGYFDKGLAVSYADQLKSEGYDTVIYGAIAYSTGGVLPDPLYSSVLEVSKPLLADTVIHELTHNTIFTASDSDFNESVANFVGQKGSLEFIRTVAGAESDLYAQAVNEEEDRALVNEFLAAVYQDLAAFYARTDLTSQDKIDQREQVFVAWRGKFQTDYLPRFHDAENMALWGDLPANNAWVLLNRRYNFGMDIFESVYQACQGNLNRTIDVLTQAAASDDAWQYLRDWVNSSTGQAP